MRCYILLALVCTYACCVHIAAQDLHFTQVSAQPLWLNPAFSGAFDGQVRISATLRDQWRAIPVPWQTFTLGADTHLPNPFTQKHKRALGLGLLLAQDQAGDLRYGQLIAQLALAASLLQTPLYHLRIGISAGFTQQQIDPQHMRTGTQFDGDRFDPNLAPSEPVAHTRIQGIQWQSGIYSRLSPNTTWTVEASIGLSRMRFFTSFLTTEPFVRPYRLHVYLKPTWQIHPSWDVVVSIFRQKQDPYQALITSAQLRRWITRNPAAPIHTSVGIAWRFSDAIAPLIQIQWHAWEVGMSYDIHTSPFASATHGQGGPELYVRYIYRMVQSPPTFKACPIF